jgi:hypothetical protein
MAVYTPVVDGAKQGIEENGLLLNEGLKQVQKFLNRLPKEGIPENFELAQLADIFNKTASHFSTADGSISLEQNITDIKRSSQLFSYMRRQSENLTTAAQQLLQLPLGPDRDRRMIEHLKQENLYLQFSSSIIEAIGDSRYNDSKKDERFNRHKQLVEERTDQIKALSSAFSNPKTLIQALQPTPAPRPHPPLFNPDQFAGKVIKDHLKESRFS